MIAAVKNAKIESPTEAATAGTVSYALGDSFNLRLFIHYVGDIH